MQKRHSVFGGAWHSWRLLSAALAMFLFSACADSAADLGPGNLLKNPDFSQLKDGLPDGWQLGEGADRKGRISVGRDAAGQSVVTFEPNANNVDEERFNKPFSLGQGYAAGPFRGKTLYVEVEAGATGAAKAVIAVYAHRKGGEVIGTRLTQPDSGGKLVHQSGILAIPDDDNTKFVVLVCLAEGSSGTATFANAYLGTTKPGGAAAAAAAVAGAEISVSAADTVRRIPSTLYGANLEWIWDGDSLWDAGRQQLDPALVALTKQIRPTLLRFPGGIFCDFYHWRDGIGPREKRPTTAHTPGGPESKHDFGTDEALQFADQVGASLLITVNIATGTPEEAADWVRYVNHPEAGTDKPPRVLYWEVGNENYIKGDAAYLKQATFPPDEYADRFLKFAKAMRAVDPRIKLCAISDDTFSRSFVPAYKNWTETVLGKAAGDIDCIALHNGYSPMMPKDEGWDVRSVYKAMIASPVLIEESLARVDAQIRQFAPARADRIGIAVTEWGPFFQLTPDGRFIDHGKTLGSALFVAGAFNAYLSSTRTEAALFFKLVDRLWMGWIGPRGDGFAPKASFEAFKLYRDHFGDTLVKTSVRGPTYDSPAVGVVDALANVPMLSAVASLGNGGATLHLLVVNRNLDAATSARVNLAGFKPAGTATATTLSGTGIDSNTGTELFKAPGIKWAKQAEDKQNPRFGAGAPAEISVGTRAVEQVGAQFSYEFPAHSITVLEFKSQP